MGGYGPLRAHPFFESITWENLQHQTPPKLTAYLPAMSEDDEDCYGNVSPLACVRTHPSVAVCVCECVVYVCECAHYVCAGVGTCVGVSGCACVHACVCRGQPHGAVCHHSLVHSGSVLGPWEPSLWDAWLERLAQICWWLSTVYPQPSPPNREPGKHPLPICPKHRLPGPGSEGTSCS